VVQREVQGGAVQVLEICSCRLSNTQSDSYRCCLN
jgi:hypothetical protein